MTTPLRETQNVRQRLWAAYAIDHIDVRHMHLMISILLRLEAGDRISPEELVWLSDTHYFSRFPRIKQQYHLNEAWHYVRCSETDGDPWHTVNASSHYRKANLPTEGLEILAEVDIASQRNQHLKSALCTTTGGCKRDLHQYDDALDLAWGAHSFDPASFHPCTLLGALCYEIGNYSLGDEWFAAAVARGAAVGAVDHELRSIFMRSDDAGQEELKHHLLSIDPDRYSWVNSQSHHRRGNGNTGSH